MDEAHQAASIEPSLTKIRHKLDELAQLQCNYRAITKQNTMQLPSKYNAMTKCFINQD